MKTNAYATALLYLCSAFDGVCPKHQRNNDFCCTSGMFFGFFVDV